MAKLYPKNDCPVQVETTQTVKQSKDPSPDKSWGLASFAKGLLSGQVSPEVQEARLAVCRACTATDSKGERLFREIAGKMYCGVPRLEQLLRNEVQNGCGCELRLKVSRVGSGCPLNLW